MDKVFEEMKKKCPWQYQHREVLQTQNRCSATKSDCSIETCAPFHWINELILTLWVAAEKKDVTE